MTQELIELRACIVEQRYDDALVILDELEGMSKQAILQKIENFAVRMLAHLITNHLEQRLTNSWAASIRDSLGKIQSLNLKDNKKSYYLPENEWDELLKIAFADAVFEASKKIQGGEYQPLQLSALINKEAILDTPKRMILLTYTDSKKTLRDLIYLKLIRLPGGDNWNVK